MKLWVYRFSCVIRFISLFFNEAFVHFGKEEQSASGCWQSNEISAQISKPNTRTHTNTNTNERIQHPQWLTTSNFSSDMLWLSITFVNVFIIYSVSFFAIFSVLIIIFSLWFVCCIRLPCSELQNIFVVIYLWISAFIWRERRAKKWQRQLQRVRNGPVDMNVSLCSGISSFVTLGELIITNIPRIIVDLMAYRILLWNGHWMTKERHICEHETYGWHIHKQTVGRRAEGTEIGRKKNDIALSLMTYAHPNFSLGSAPSSLSGKHLVVVVVAFLCVFVCALMMWLLATGKFARFN